MADRMRVRSPDALSRGFGVESVYADGEFRVWFFWFKIESTGPEIIRRR
ncbi:MAG: hypothetical protein PF483_12010 [Halothiobacillus sp.]|jgi:hypothetical protein|nr:hypothetical protein [Halothiobacillus sp.]